MTIEYIDTTAEAYLKTVEYLEGRIEALMLQALNKRIGPIKKPIKLEMEIDPEDGITSPIRGLILMNGSVEPDSTVPGGWTFKADDTGEITSIGWQEKGSDYVHGIGSLTPIANRLIINAMLHGNFNRSKEVITNDMLV